ncbi:hypothetical protein, partial [Thermogemmata fonticola]|uniref:hypothetical protein n=1 Tax=Thermogemmata fonticola TaxID=2755323 RepID=UPI001E523BFB
MFRQVRQMQRPFSVRLVRSVPKVAESAAIAGSTVSLEELRTALPRPQPSLAVPNSAVEGGQSPPSRLGRSLGRPMLPKRSP